MPMSSASGLADSSSLASASIGNDNGMVPSQVLLTSWHGRDGHPGPGRNYSGTARRFTRRGRYVVNLSDSGSPPRPQPLGGDVSGRTKIAIGGVIIGLILLWLLPFWEIGAVIILAAIAVPVAAYLMLDPSQRRRLKNIQQRRREIR
jgi:hypothetical protein